MAQKKHFNTIETLPNSFFADLHKRLSCSSASDDAKFHLTEIVDRDDTGGHSERFKAKLKEIKSLLDGGTFKMILRQQVPTDGNVLPSTFILTIKSAEDDKIKFKARYVLRRHEDLFKHVMVHTMSNLQSQHIQLLLALAVIHCFDIWTPDVCQVYLQSAEPLARDIFITYPVP